MYGTAKLSSKQKKIILYTIFGWIIISIGIVGLGLTGNEIRTSSSHLEISGLYGETITLNDLESIELVEQRPVMSRRIHGFSMGYRKKGIFKNQDGERIKLLINTKYRPFILIKKESGQNIYFSSDARSNEDIFKELKSSYPTKVKIGFP
ncbi:hypothetical protein [Muriicola sp.]|uniref:hypothetical protein n=1 Tax=Muriicola sp. TaxID=2020856 RepID=UPI003C783897